jgi:protein SCO1/2
MRPEIGATGRVMAVSTKSIALAATATAAIFLVALYAVGRKGQIDAFSACRTTQIAGGAAAIGGPFTLIDEDGRAVTEADVLAKPALVYFGYTYCPDVCPVDVARNAGAVDVLEEKGYEVTPVFISVDPRRDTPEVLKEWTGYLHPRMIGLTGSEEQIKAVAQAYKTYFKVPDDAEGDAYLVDHMTQTYMMVPQVGFVEFFNRDESADAVAERAACFLDAIPAN